MPAGKQDQGGALLYGLITFVVLFLVATTLAIMSYLKLEDANSTAQKESQAKKEMNKTLKVAQKDFNELYTLTTGMVPEGATKTSLKLDATKESVKQIVAAIANIEPEIVNLDNISLLGMMSALVTERDVAILNAVNLTTAMEDMQQRWDFEVADFNVGEEKLIAEKKEFQQQADSVQSNVDQIFETDQQANQQRVNSLQMKIYDKDSQLKDKSDELQLAQSDLQASDKSRKDLELQLEVIKPRPDIEVEAFKTDAKIISVDLQTGIAYLNVGSNDKVYRGLTFSIFDKSAPIPLDGKGKAEVKVFDVQPNIAAVKIVQMEKKTPIIANDIAINLIWNSETPNTFAVAGDFDFDGDGTVDYDGRDKVIKLIERWGGIVIGEIDINTDFIVMGTSPRRLPEPTEEQMDVDPLAQDKYEQSMELFSQYSTVLSKAKALSIPVFNTARFKNLIGFDTEANMSKPF